MTLRDDALKLHLENHGKLAVVSNTFPVELHLKAVGALTLHTGVRDRRMKHTGAASALYEKRQVPLPSVWSSLQMYKKSA